MYGWLRERRAGSLAAALAVLAATAFALVGMPAASRAASSPGHSPVPVFSSANGVSCPRASTCFAVGAYNADDVVGVLTEFWNGKTWAVLPAPAPRDAVSSVLNAVSCTDAAHCLAVGSYTDRSYDSWPLAEAWDGSSWSVVDTPVPAGGTSAGLAGVSCPSESYCVAVGSYTNSRSVPVTLTEFWDGSAWSIVRSPNPRGAGSSGLAAVSCAGLSSCMAAGSAIDADSVAGTLTESWDGTRWSIVASPNPEGAQSSFLDGIACPTAERCMAVGGYYDNDFVAVTLAESWDGARWTVVASPTPAGSPSSALYGVSCAGATDCVAVGHSYSASFAAKDETLAESWNGSAWTIVAAPSPSTSSALYGVSCARAAKCLAAGLFFNSSGNYQTLAESWNGTTFSIVNQDAVLAGVSCVDALHCTAVGSAISRQSVSATLAEVWNGKSWRTIRTPDPAGSEGSYLEAVACVSVDRCLAVGYYYGSDNTRRTLIESWNGTRWSILDSPNPADAAYSVLYGISCTGEAQCMAVGSAAGRVLAESWDGARWTIVPTADPASTAYSELTGISCTGATHCLAVGYETDTYYHADLTLAEEWDGSAWRIVPSAAPGKNLFRASLLHGIACGGGSCLAVGLHQRRSGTFATFTERWTGHSWVALGSPSPAGSGYAELSAISCADTGRCLAVGDYLDGSGNFVPLSETWTGTEWSVVGSAGATPRSAISYLLGLSCATASRCVAVGTSGDPANLDTLSRYWDGSEWSVARRVDGYN